MQLKNGLALALVGRNVKRFRGGLGFKAHRLFYHSTLGSRVIKKKKRREKEGAPSSDAAAEWPGPGLSSLELSDTQSL